jgi:hypothetical protein
MTGRRTIAIAGLIAAFLLQRAAVVTAYPLQFIQMSGVRTIVPDQDRNKLYLGFVNAYPYDLGTGELMLSNPFPGIGDPQELSPDRRLMLAAVNGSSSEHPGMSWVSVHNLVEGTSADYFFPREPHETGAWDAAFADNETILVTTSYDGSGRTPLRKIDLQTGTVTNLGIVEEETALAASANHAVVAFAEGNSTGGFFGYYDVADGSIHSGGRANHHVHDITVNRFGMRFAIPSVAGVDVFDKSFSKVGNLPADFPTRYPSDVLYSPVSDVLYVSWTGSVSVGIAPKSIVAYNANTLAVLKTIDEAAFSDSREFQQLSLSQDGTRLYVIQNHNFDGGRGIGIYDVSQFGVPEPSVLAHLLVGMFGLSAVARRRRC